MIFYNRNVKGRTVAESDAFEYQAAINSNGVITIRGITKDLPTDIHGAEETMLVLIKRETQAIFSLMRVLSQHTKNDDLPF